MKYSKILTKRHIDVCHMDFFLFQLPTIVELKCAALNNNKKKKKIVLSDRDEGEQPLFRGRKTLQLVDNENSFINP